MEGRSRGMQNIMKKPLCLATSTFPLSEDTLTAFQLPCRHYTLYHAMAYLNLGKHTGRERLSSRGSLCSQTNFITHSSAVRS